MFLSRTAEKGKTSDSTVTYWEIMGRVYCESQHIIFLRLWGSGWPEMNKNERYGTNVFTGIRITDMERSSSTKWALADGTFSKLPIAKENYDFDFLCPVSMVKQLFAIENDSREFDVKCWAAIWRARASITRATLTQKVSKSRWKSFGKSMPIPHMLSTERRAKQPTISISSNSENDSEESIEKEPTTKKQKRSLTSVKKEKKPVKSNKTSLNVKNEKKQKVGRGFAKLTKTANTSSSSETSSSDSETDQDSEKIKELDYKWAVKKFRKHSEKMQQLEDDYNAIVTENANANSKLETLKTANESLTSQLELARDINIKVQSQKPSNITLPPLSGVYSKLAEKVAKTVPQSATSSTIKTLIQARLLQLSDESWHIYESKIQDGLEFAKSLLENKDQ